MLENKYNFEFPQLYKDLLEDRMLDYTASHYLLDYKFFHLHKQAQVIGMDFALV